MGVETQSGPKLLQLNPESASTSNETTAFLTFSAIDRPLHEATRTAT